MYRVGEDAKEDMLGVPGAAEEAQPLISKRGATMSTLAGCDGDCGSAAALEGDEGEDVEKGAVVVSARSTLGWPAATA